MLDYELLFAKLEGRDPYRTLPLVIDKHQHRYTQMFRKGRIALYKQEYRPDSGFENISTHYEVIIIRFNKGDKTLGIVPHEAYPSTYDWGIKGWTFIRYEDATYKLGQLLMRGKFNEDIV